jgi:hypothetical protein
VTRENVMKESVISIFSELERQHNDEKKELKRKYKELERKYDEKLDRHEAEILEKVKNGIVTECGACEKLKLSELDCCNLCDNKLCQDCVEQCCSEYKCEPHCIECLAECSKCGGYYCDTCIVQTKTDIWTCYDCVK